MWPAIIAGIGMAAQGIGSAVSAKEQAEAQRVAAYRQQRNLEKARENINDAYNKIDERLDDYGDLVRGNRITGQTELDQYRDLVRNYDPSKFVAERGEFDKSNYNIDDFYSKNRDKIIGAATDAVQRSAAGAGIGRGTGAAADIAAAAVDKNAELEEQAYNRMQNERKFDYDEFQAQYQANQAALDKLAQGAQTQMANLGGAIQYDQQSEADLIADILAAKQGRAQAEANLLT